MSSFTVLLLCIQACLVQNAFSQACLGAYGPAITPGLAYNGLAYPASGFAAAPCGYGAGIAELAYPAGLGLAGAYPGNFGYAGAYPAVGYGAAAYGGAGEGHVVVAGELPVAGNTAVAGQVPIMGAVGFSGPVAAAGAVSIAGKCACGCGSPFY